MLDNLKIAKNLPSIAVAVVLTYLVSALRAYMMSGTVLMQMYSSSSTSLACTTTISLSGTSGSGIEARSVPTVMGCY